MIDEKLKVFSMDVFDEYDEQEVDFPLAQRVSRESFLRGLHIDPQDPANSIIKIKEVAFNVDRFLYEHYRYSQLDDLQGELTTLLASLDQELFDMVNNDYFDFINLGKTLDGGEGLVDRLRVDVTKYRKRLVDEDKRLEESQSHVKSSLENIKKLQELKRHAENMLLLDNFIDKFELLLSQNKDSIQIEVLKQLTSLYLTIHQIITTLPSYQFVAHKLDTINVLRYEFKGVLDEYLRGLSTDSTTYKDIVDVLGIYSIIGDESRAIELLKESKREREAP